MQQNQRRTEIYETIDVQTRTVYDRFLQFEHLMKMHPPSSLERFNPTPLGLCAFALTLFIFSMYEAGVGVPVESSPNLVMGVALFYGGLIQLIAGLLEYRVRNNFHALMFCSYGGFWLGIASYNSNLINHSANDDESISIIQQAYGIFFLAWTIFTVLMLISSLRTNLILVLFFCSLTITFILLSACYFQFRHLNLQRAAGAFGIVTSIIAWYGAFANLLKQGENSYFSLPVYNLKS